MEKGSREQDPCTIGVLSRQSGVKVETIRYYERIGLLTPPPRSAGGHRLYSEVMRRRLFFVRRARNLGFSIEQVRSLLTLVDGAAYTCAEIYGLTQHHLEEVRAKIDALRRLEKVLSEVADTCSRDQIPDCPIVEALSTTDDSG